MEFRKVSIITSASSIVVLIIVIVVARVSLGLSKTFFLIAGPCITAILAIFTWLLIQRRFDRRRILLETQLASEGRELRIEYSFLRKVAGVPTKFQYKELEEATDNFQAVIGQGSSGSIFKGILTDGTSIAVKRIEGEEHGDREFRSEVAAIASVQHVNLVRLLGYCRVPRGPRFLIYEFVHNGSLDNWIFPPRSSRRNRRGGCLPWGMRYRIAIDVAKALAYLHHDCLSRILHLDVKPENILLDESFRAIVSDFGLSKLMGKDVSRVVTTVRGTRGYLAPEWLLENGISEKSDIYSYGMVLLEITGGRRNVRLIGAGNNAQKKWSYFPKIVTQKLREGKLMEVVDERLVGDGGVDEKEVRDLVLVALWCIQEKAKLRPSMTCVVEMLEGRTGVEVPPETEMLVVDLLSIDQESIHGSNRGEVATLVTHQMDSQIPSSSAYSLTTMSVLSGR